MKRRRKVEFPIDCSVVLILPLLLITAPFVLAFMAIQERWQRCPNCKRRGMLERVFRVREPDEEAGVRWSLERPRIRPEPERWRCRVCGYQTEPEKTENWERR